MPIKSTDKIEITTEPSDPTPSGNGEDITVMRDDSGKFLPGTHAYNGVGRPKGAVGGRAKSLKTLDALLSSERNQTTLKKAFQAEFDKNPIRFFRQIIMPLLPQNVKLDLQAEGVVTWLSLSNITPTKPSERSTAPVIDVSEQCVVVEDGERPKP